MLISITSEAYDQQNKKKHRRKWADTLVPKYLLHGPPQDPTHSTTPIEMPTKWVMDSRDRKICICYPISPLGDIWFTGSFNLMTPLPTLSRHFLRLSDPAGMEHSRVNIISRDPYRNLHAFSLNKKMDIYRDVSPQAVVMFLIKCLFENEQTGICVYFVNQGMSCRKRRRMCFLVPPHTAPSTELTERTQEKNTRRRKQCMAVSPLSALELVTCNTKRADNPQKQA